MEKLRKTVREETTAVFASGPMPEALRMSEHKTAPPLSDLEPWFPHLQVSTTSAVAIEIILIAPQSNAPRVTTVQLGVMVLV